MTRRRGQRNGPNQTLTLPIAEKICERWRKPNPGIEPDRAISFDGRFDNCTSRMANKAAFAV